MAAVTSCEKLYNVFNLTLFSEVVTAVIKFKLENYSLM